VSGVKSPASAVTSTIDVQLRALEDGTDAVVLDTGVSYLPDRPVRIRVRKRDGRYDMSDDAAAVTLAGHPLGWLSTMTHAVAEQCMNVNRRGVIFVTGFAGRDLASLARRLAECSRLTYLTLLETSD
jgi:hypothetical protein